MTKQTRWVGLLLLLGFSLAGLVGKDSSAKAPNPVRELQAAQGVQAALYNEESGYRYLEVGYEKVGTEYAKLGFFRVGVPILKVENLRLVLDPGQADYQALRDKMMKFAGSKGMRFVVAAPASLRIRSKEGAEVVVRAGRAKLGSDGSLRCHAGVTVVEGNATSSHAVLNVTADDALPGFQFVSAEGRVIKVVRFAENAAARGRGVPAE